MNEGDSYIPESAMAIFAHPDDIEFSCAGTVAKWVAAGARVAYVLVTSGDVGIAKKGMTNAKAAEIREAETLAAAAVVGVTDVTFLRVPDGMVENTMELRHKIVREIRRFRPEVVFTGDPTMVFTPWGGINHPDHRAVAGATIDALFPAIGQPNLFQDLEQEGIYAFKVRKVYVTARGEGGTIVSINDSMEKKIESLLKHDSQLGRIEGLADRMRERASERAKHIDGIKYAEIFKVITLESDENWEKWRGNVYRLED